MPDNKNKAKGTKRMTKAGAAKRAEQPVLGEAALKEALAEFGVTPNTAAANGSHPAAQPQAHAEAQPKTVAQVLGEITWLMTQSPRHKALALGDLEWLVMPAILLNSSGFSTRASSRSASRYGRWWMNSWRNGSTRATSG
jgi:cytolysin-activating lysine-acyltransferase